MKKVIIADVKSRNANGIIEGHYVSVAHNYTDNLSEYFDVIVAGGPVYNKYFDNAINLGEDTKDDNSGLKNRVIAIKNGITLLKNCRSNPDNVIVFQHSGVISVFIALLLTKSTSDIYLIQYDATSIQNSAGRAIFSLIKHKIKGLICPDEKIGKAYGIPYCVVPDYIYCDGDKKPTIHKEKVLNYDFGMFGAITDGKGIYEATEFLAKRGYKVLIAGKIGNQEVDQSMGNRLRKLSDSYKNITIELRFLTEKEYRGYIGEVKYCILNYMDVYADRSSGVILDALFNNKPVVARDRSFVKFVKEAQIGYVYEKLDDIDFEYLMSPEVYKTYLKNISNYLSVQSKHKDKLRHFIDGEVES